jgi:hypothetical protein
MKTDNPTAATAEQGRQEHHRLDLLIGRSLLDALGPGRPACRTQVRRLWEGHYRVNLLTGADPASTRIVGSYFLVVDGDGNILTSTPRITGATGPGPLPITS